MRWSFTFVLEFLKCIRGLPQMTTELGHFLILLVRGGGKSFCPCWITEAFLSSLLSQCSWFQDRLRMQWLQVWSLFSESASHAHSRWPDVLHGKLSVWLWHYQRTDTVPVSLSWPPAGSGWEDLCGWVVKPRLSDCGLSRQRKKVKGNVNKKKRLFFRR